MASNLYEKLTATEEIKESIKDTDENLRSAISALELANRLQDEKIKKLEDDIKEPKFLAEFVTKYRWVMVSIFSVLLVAIIWLVLHCWDLYRQFNNDRFNSLKDYIELQIKNSYNSQELVIENKINSRMLVYESSELKKK